MAMTVLLTLLAEAGRGWLGMFMPNLDGQAATGLHRAPWMAGIAQLVERQVVVLDVTGSSPVARPTLPSCPNLVP